MPPATTTASWSLVGCGPAVAERATEAERRALIRVAHGARDRADGAHGENDGPAAPVAPLTEIGTSPTPNA